MCPLSAHPGNWLISARHRSCQTPLGMFSCSCNLFSQVLLIFVTRPVICGGRGGLPAVTSFRAFQTKVLGASLPWQLPHLEWRCGGQRFCWKLIWCVRCEVSALGPLKASGTKLSTKQEVRPYHLDSVLFFPGTPVSFAGDKFVISRACALMNVIEVSTNLSWFILGFLFISIIELMIMNENNGFYLVGMRIKLSMMTLLTFFLSPIFQHYHPCQHHRWMEMACRLTFLIFYCFINLFFLFPGL